MDHRKMPHEYVTQALGLLVEIDEAFVEHQAHVEERDGVPHPCRPGCAACCYGPFDVSRSDLLVLLEGLSTLSDDERRLTLQAIRSAARRQRQVLDIDPDDPADLDALGDEILDAMCDALIETPCPLLDESTQTCRTYPWRPQPCRLRGARWTAGTEELDFSCPIGLTEGHPQIGMDIIDLNDRFARLELRARTLGLPEDRTTIALGLDSLLRAR